MNFLYIGNFSFLFNFLNQFNLSGLVEVDLVNTVLNNSMFYYSLGIIMSLGLISFTSNAINKIGQGVLTGTGIAIGKKLGDFVIDSVTSNKGDSSNKGSSSGGSSGGSNTTNSGDSTNKSSGK